jgi:outer membrane protein
MKRLTPVFLILLAGCTVHAAEPATNLTLDQALGSVEGTNLNVLLSREAAVQALAQAGIARSAILPNISASAQQRRSKSISTSSATGTLTSGAPSNRFDGLLTGSVNLLDPQRISALQSARLGVDISKADYDATVQAVLASVADSFFTHLRNLSRMDVLNANIARARTLLDLARKQLAVGVIVTQIDVTRAEAQVAQAEQARLQQETVNYQSELLLKRALDIPILRPVRLVEFNLRQGDLAGTTLGDDPGVFARRADYVRAQKSVQQAKVDVRSATFERLPALALSGQYGVGAAKFNDSDRQNEWFAGATLSMPLFDGLRSGADRRLALSRQRSQEMRLHNLELQISAELRLAVQDANSRQAQITVAAKNLQLAEQQLRLAQERYRNGVADNREVVEAQNQLAVAADNLVEANYQYNLSRVELARVRGDVRSILAEKAP